MTATDIQIQVEEISQAMVLLDASNTAGLARIGEQLQELAGVMTESDHQQAAAVALGVAAVIADGADQERSGCEASAEIIAAVNQALEIIQEMLDQPGSFDPAGSSALALEDPGRPKEAADSGRDLPDGLTYSPLIDEEIISEFLNRQSDSIEDLEKSILACEAGSDDEALKQLKRWFHTLKGESGLLGMSDVATVCHAAEDMIQNEPPASCVDRLLAVKDWLLACFDYVTGRGPAPANVDQIIGQLAQAHEPPLPAEVELPDYTNKSVLEGDVDLLQDFIAESFEHLNSSEAHLLTIEEDPRAFESLNAVFRAFHTIKGLAGFAELDHIQALAHLAESLLDQARRGDIELCGPPMDIVFESVDMMKRLIEGVVAALAGSGYLEQEKPLPDLLARLEKATSTSPKAGCSDPMEAEIGPEPVTEPEPCDEAEETTATASALAGKSGFVPLGDLARRAKAQRDKAGKFVKASERCVISVNDPATSPARNDDPQLDGSSPIRESDDREDVSADAPDLARGARESGKPGASVKVKEAMRVDAERLDRLIETIGEMVIAESMVSQNPEIRASIGVKLARDLDHLDKICRELQEIGMSLRMVPVRPVFQKMARLVRDLAKKTGRKVEFVMSGEDTELDKNVVDKIGDPLVHMVRNAVDHGLEASTEERRAAGKPETGRIELRAFHKGGNICIEIQDDGRGLPRDKILAKAIERGLIREGEVLGDREIHNLIFEAGFSTAQKVTDISGRGVGMDVVRRNIEELRGTCEISSEPGKGSTFSIKLPLTLAIIEGMVVSCGPEHYIVPTLSVVRLVRPRPEDISEVFDRGELLAFEDEHLPLYRLGTLFNVRSAKTDPLEAVVVVVEEEKRKIGLLADDLLGQQSIVIKSLGEAMHNTEGVAGGAIMSNGNVALIVDVAGLIRAAHSATPALARSETQSG